MDDSHQDRTSAPVTPPAQSSPARTTAVDNKLLYGILGYILPFLFFLPLIDEKLKTDTSARFHANQQLMVLIAGIALYVVAAILVPIAFILNPLINIIILVFAVLGIMSVAKGENKELPVIGQFKIIK